MILRLPSLLLMVFALGLIPMRSAAGQVVHERTSPYHHVRVVEEGKMRLLCFDDAWETRMSLDDPLQGHFEYIEYFHMPWLWNTQVTSVLMVGLGGGSAQRLFAHYYPDLRIETVEIDPVVLQVAKSYFFFKESDRQKVHLEDGRVFLRRTQSKYDVIMLDAYVQGRYGSSIPQHLATKEFFEIVRDRLTTNGVVAFNVIGTTGGWHANIIGAIYQTLKAVFPQVYHFSCGSSQNVVLLATKAGVRVELPALTQRAAHLVKTGRITWPGFQDRLRQFQNKPPLTAGRSPVLTDDYAPVEGLSK